MVDKQLKYFTLHFEIGGELVAYRDGECFKLKPSEAIAIGSPKVVYGLAPIEQLVEEFCPLVRDELNREANAFYFMDRSITGRSGSVIQFYYIPELAEF